VKSCHIYPVSAGQGAYQWKWKCIEGKRQSGSSRSFELFYDCVEDARNHGVDIDLGRAHHEIKDETINSEIVAESSKHSKSSKGSRSHRARG
jgi:hypothetical protein